MKVQFTVSTENVVEFADVLEENELNNSIAGSTQDGNLLIDVQFTSETRDLLDTLADLSESDEEDK